MFTILTTSCTWVGQVAGWPTHIPSPTGCGMWPRLGLLRCMQCSRSLPVFASALVLLQVMPSGCVPQLLSSPMASPCLCPRKDDPWSCGRSLSPTLSLYLASWSGSLEFCSLDFETSISQSLCFLLSLGVPDCAAQRCYLRSSAFHVSTSVLLLLRKAVFLAELFPLFKYFCCFCF